MKLGAYFRQAIEDGDWLKVCKVFTTITGEDIEPPEVKTNLADLDIGEDEEQEPTSPAELEIPDEDEEEEPDEEEPESTKVEAQTPPQPQSTRRAAVEQFRVNRPESLPSDDKRRAARKISLEGRKGANRFKDNLALAAKDSIKVNPKLGVQNPVPRGQRDLIEGATDTSKRIKVVCSLCGKKEVVVEALAVGWFKDKPNTPIEDRNNTYKCNACQTPSGRAKLARAERNERNRR